MGRYHAGMTAAGAGTTVRPIFGILATAAVSPKLREISVWNNTGTACEFRLVYLTGGTPGATVTAFADDLGMLATPTCLAKQLWTADATIVADCGPRIRLGAADGSSAFHVFGDNGIRPLLGATAAIGLVPVGTGQIVSVSFAWDE